MTAGDTLFRVHFEDGTAVDVAAATPDQARALARRRHPGTVTKVKKVRNHG